jgi:predicted Zn-dependent protease
MAVSGNILPLLSSIEAVADDLQFLAGGVGATMLLRDISVSGR